MHIDEAAFVLSSGVEGFSLLGGVPVIFVEAVVVRGVDDSDFAFCEWYQPDLRIAWLGRRGSGDGLFPSEVSADAGLSGDGEGAAGVLPIYADKEGRGIGDNFDGVNTIAAFMRH